MHEVIFRLIVSEARNAEEAEQMAIDYFCGGDYAGLVTQHDTEVRNVQESEAAEAR